MVDRMDTKISFSRQIGGTQDPNTGAYVSIAPTLVFEGLCDYEDGVSRRNAERLSQMYGIEHQTVSFTVFLNDESKIMDLQIEDQGQLELPNGEIFQVEIIGIRRLDGTLFLKHNAN